MTKIGIYVHIPFCKSKCFYCDFNSFANKESFVEEYMECLNKELINKAKKDYLVKTIYIGGGTPSFVSEYYIESVFNILRKCYNIDKEAEISIEVNPGTVNRKKLKKYYDLGINRLSVGLQSANNTILKDIGRIHTYEQYVDTIKLAKEIGFTNINSDIIIGLPNQTIEDVKHTISKILELGLMHVSVYSLIVEEGTLLSKRIKSGDMTIPDEDLERDMYWLSDELLKKNGYIHYEISNYAQKGYMSKHNLDCWNQKEYIGFGVNASSYENNIRYSNIKDIEVFISNVQKGFFKDNIIIEERQNIQEKMNEYMILGLRKIEGIRVKDFIQKFNKNPIELYQSTLYRLMHSSLIEVNSEYIKLSHKGIDLANIVWEMFI